MNTQGQEIKYIFPTGYWGLINSADDLYLGFSEEFEYDMELQGQSFNANMLLEINEIEDVTVTAGTFADCYVLEIKQNFSSLGYETPLVEMKIWINSQGQVPKIETIMGNFGYFDDDDNGMTQELEGYYRSI